VAVAGEKLSSMSYFSTSITNSAVAKLERATPLVLKPAFGNDLEPIRSSSHSPSKHFEKRKIMALTFAFQWYCTHWNIAEPVTRHAPSRRPPRA
jgi:hypothetical protein